MPPGMAGTPRLQEIERLAAADLADDHAVGSQAQRRAHEIGHARRRPRRVRSGT